MPAKRTAIAWLLMTLLSVLNLPGQAAQGGSTANTTLSLGLILHGGEIVTIAEETARAFEALHPGVKVEVLSLPPQGDYYEAIPTLAMAGSLPDIFPTGSRERTSLAHAGILADLTPFVRQDPSFLRSFLPPLRSGIQLEGRYLGLPLSMEVWSAQFNRDFFSEAGLTQPDQLYRAGEWNFAQLSPMARKLTRWSSDGKLERIGLYTNADNEVSFPWVWGMGQRIFSEDGRQVYLDQPGVREGYRFFNNLLNEQRVANIVQTPWGVGWDGFTTGKWGISMWWSDILTIYKTEWKLPYRYGALPFPAGPESDTTNLITLWTWSMSAQSSKKALAWELMRMLAGPQVDKRLLEAGQSRWPLHVENIRFSQEMLVRAWQIDNVALLFEGVGRSAEVWRAPITKRATDTLTKLLYPAFTGEQPLEPTLIEAQRQIAEILAD